MGRPTERPSILQNSFMQDMISRYAYGLEIWWITVISGAVTLFFFFRWKKSVTNVKPEKNIQSEPKKLLNVFDVSKKSQANSSAKNKKQQTDPNDKPFSSSYYYAHNNPNATGGYKDGLSMEDYVMNQPKLLSRNGVAVHTDSSSKEAKGSSKTIPSHSFHSIPMNRYMWDDDGNSDGIAKIYFDSLPSVSDSSITWQAARITASDVKIKLIRTQSSCSLLVQIKRLPTKENTTSKNTRYHFYVAHTYGNIQEAQLILKTKHLIVKITKDKTRGNRVAWPQVHAKGSQSKEYIDMDLFREDEDNVLVNQ